MHGCSHVGVMLLHRGGVQYGCMQSLRMCVPCCEVREDELMELLQRFIVPSFVYVVEDGFNAHGEEMETCINNM